MSLSSPDPIVAAFERLAAREPAAPMVVSPSRCATRSDVDAWSRAIERRLDAEPLRRGQVVAFAAPVGPVWFAGYLALRRAGFVPLLLDSQTPVAEQQRCARGLGAAARLAIATTWEQSAADEALVDVHRDAAPLVHDAPAGAIKVTSGTTGASRGVLAPSAALIADEEQIARTMGIVDEDRFLAAIPLSHSYGLSSIVLPALLRGSVVVVPDEPGPFGPLAAARAAGATVFPTVPAWLAALTRLAEPPAWPESLRLVISAGAPLAPEVSRRFRERYAQCVHVFYGASECGGIAYDRAGTAAEEGHVGTPLEGVRIELEGADDGGDDSRGRPGNDTGIVTVVSPAVASQYLPEPAAELSDGKFRTADLACWRDGNLQLCGRVDDVINVKGKKVAPREVEAVLRAMPGVADAVVLGVPAAEGGQIVRAVIETAGAGLTYAAVLDWCRTRLADYKLPRSVVILSELPRTSRGKADRAALMMIPTP